jgi:hypothetical protein
MAFAPIDFCRFPVKMIQQRVVYATEGIKMSLFGPPNVQKMAAAKDVEGLIKALGHADQAIRHQAVTALAQIGDPRAISPLTQTLFYRAPNSVQHRQDVAEALARFGAPGVRPLIAGLPITLSSGDPKLIASYRTALAVIGWSPGSYGIVEAYIEASSTGGRDVSDFLAEVLERIGGMEKQRTDSARLTEERRKEFEKRQAAAAARDCKGQHVLEGKCGVCKRCGKSIHDFSSQCICRRCGHKEHNFGEGVYSGFFHRCMRCGAEMHVHTGNITGSSW